MSARLILTNNINFVGHTVKKTSVDFTVKYLGLNNILFVKLNTNNRNKWTRI